ncbi:MAG TPA: Crp/Fnr family transcriptional regulator [Bdellovibrionota bacterium]|nr:Crp/Fnr family transcriptional regulator [Bdellovibrionota bacterium]
MPVAKSHPALPALYATLSALAPLPPTEAENLRAAIREEKLAAGGSMSPQTIGFVITGLLRAFYVDADGKERTKAFWPEGVLAYSLGATQAHPGASDEDLEDWTVQAVEPSHVFTLALADLDRLYGGHPCWNHIGRVFWQHAYREKMVREREFLLLSATERYRRLAGRDPALLDRIPQYLVASYLGITPVALSRLRGRKVPAKRPRR